MPATPMTLELVQSEVYERTLRWLVTTDNGDGTSTTEVKSFDGYSFRAQVRKKELSSSPLLMDLTPYLSIVRTDDPLTDARAMLLHIPATALTALDPRGFGDDAAWDLFIWPTGQPESAIAFLAGPATLDPAATDMRGA